MMEDAWKNFEVSGKITDYLNYCNVKQQTAGKNSGEKFSEKGMSSYGTKCCSDRNDFKCDAGWRI